eukprot:ANDGO_02713.mRNA.1 Cathepsin B-like cysteine proteinase 5
MLKYAVVALVALAVLVSADGPWSSCGTSADHLKVSSLTISPNPLARGQPFSVSFSGSLDEQVTGGSVAIKVSYQRIPVYGKTVDLCQLVQQGGASCPLPAGPVTFTQSETFPSSPPKGTYEGQITITDSNGQQITCIKFDMPVTAPADFDMALDDAIIAEVNRGDNGWTAHRSPRFEGLTIAQAKQMLKINEAKFNNVPSVAMHLDAVPTNFDARTQWPNCIHPIRDQQQCGSCWAFSASEALSDRFCIQSNGKVNVVLSPQWLVSCDTSSLGCQGGYLDTTWEYMESTGLPTDSCVPYTSGGGDSGSCPAKCTDGSAPTFYKVKAGSSTHLPDVGTMQSNLMTYGPIQVAFQVYQDFMSYKTGVYKHTSGDLLGGHAVKIVGWGVDSNTPYWLVANSWGTSWGQAGFFKIIRGRNECGIESSAYAGIAAV